MELKIIEAYNASRKISDKAFISGCYALHVSMLFDQWGNVRVCCQNYTDILGNVRQTRLRDIWTGQRYEQLRAAVDDFQFAGGCEYCKWQISDGNFDNAFSVHYDGFQVEGRGSAPRTMEFNLTNACNLQCIMCNGEFSSTLRNRRDNLPPLPRFYDDTFFEDLRPFIPGLEFVKCLGGEPFLVNEMYRIWDMMIEDRLAIRCHINTNGTVYNSKVQRVLENLPCTFQVSMDGVTKETFERVRVGADFDLVMENFKRFHEYSQRPGGYLSLTFCLMRQNWHELGSMLQLGEEYGCPVSITPVVLPSNVSLYTLPYGPLKEVIDALEKQEPAVLPTLKLNGPIWTQQLDRLRNRLEHLADTPRPVFASLRLLEPFIETPEMPRQESVDTSAIEEELASWSGSAVASLLCNSDDIVEEVESSDGTFLGIDKDECIGRRVDVVVARFREVFGGGTSIVQVDESPARVDRILSFYGPLRQETGLLRSVTVPRPSRNLDAPGSILIATLKLEPALAETQSAHES